MHGRDPVGVGMKCDDDDCLKEFCESESRIMRQIQKFKILFPAKEGVSRHNTSGRRNAHIIIALPLESILHYLFHFLVSKGYFEDSIFP